MVKVTDRGEAVAGMPVEVVTNPSGEEDAKVVAKTRTNEDGMARFILDEGKYYVTVYHGPLEKSLSIQVRRNQAKKTSVIEFDWPGEVFEAVRLAGRIEAPISSGSRMDDLIRPTFHYLSEAKIEVIEALSEKKVATFTTAGDGAFSSGDLAPGLYTVRVTRKADTQFREIDVAFAVRISERAPASFLDLQFREICGGLYAMQRKGSTS